MEYLLLWSGEIRGMRKARIPAVDAPGMTGHLGPHGLVVPCKEAVRAALPYRLRKAYDRTRGALWFNRGADTSPAFTALHDRRGRYITTLYMQPVRAC